MKKSHWLLFAAVLVLAAAGSASAESKKISVWCWDPTNNGQAMKLAAQVYNKTHPDVTIEVVDIPQNIEGKIEAGLQANGAGLPDISLFQDNQIERFIANYPGAFVDFKAAGVNYADFASFKVGPMTDGTKIYGIPFDSGSTGLFLRSDYLKQAGLNPDSYQKNLTWKEVIALGKLVKSKIGKPLIAYDNTGSEFLRMIMQSAGGQYFKADGSLDLNTPALKAGIQVIKDLSDAGILYQAEGWNNWVSAFNNGDSAGLICAIWITSTLKTQASNAGKWMLVPTPLLEGVPGAQNASAWGGSSWYVFNSSKNKALAVDFLKTVWASKTPTSLDFYNSILKNFGMMSTYIPSKEGSNFAAGDEFFYKNQKIYADFAKWQEKVPALRYTTHYAALGTALTTSLQKMFKGALKSVDAVIADTEVGYRQSVGE